MAFVDHTQGRSLAGFFFARVSGIPYLFSNVPAPAEWITLFGPAERVVLGGEQYTWSVSHIFGDTLEALKQQLAPKSGVVTNGAMRFEHAYAGDGQRRSADDPWLSLLLTTLNRTDGKMWQTLTVNLSPTGTTLTVDDNPWVAASGWPLYVGLETMRTSPGAGTPTTIPITTRGAFGSHATAHIASTRSPSVERQATGLRVSDYPLTMEGRVVEFYFVPCDLVSDGPGSQRPRPFGDPDSDEYTVVYAGLLNGISEGGDLLTFELQTKSIQSLLQVPACSFFPEATPFSTIVNENLEVERLYIGPHNNKFHVLVQFNGDAGDPFFYIDGNASLIDGDTLTIGGVIYVFKTVPTLLLHILIGGSATATTNNAVNAMIVNNFNGVNQAGGWGVNRALGRIIFFKVTTGDPSLVTMATSNATAITLSGANASRKSNIDAFYLDFGTPVDVQAPMYQAGHIYVQLQAALAPLVGIPNFTVIQSWIDQGDGRAPRFRLSFSFPGFEGMVQELGGVTFTIFPSVGGSESMLRDLGFTKEASGSSPDNGSAVELTADKAPALFRWPGPAFETPAKLFLGDFDSSDVTLAFFGGSEFQPGPAGWVDDDDALLPMVVKLGKSEMVQGVAQFVGIIPGYPYDFMTISDRGVFNALASKEIYLEVASPSKQKAVKATRVMAFENTSMERMLLYLMLGGSGLELSNDLTYDRGWRGAGADLDPRLIDIPSFEAFADLGANVRDNWVILPGDTLGDIIESEGMISQQFVTINAGRFGMIDLLAVSEADASDALLLDQTEINSSRDAGGIGFDRKENRVCNVVQTKINFNNATGKYSTQVRGSQTDSVSTWGEKRQVELAVRGLADVAGAATLAASVTQNLFGNHSQPNALIDVSVCSFRFWDASIGDPVRLTHAALPGLTAPGHGVVDLPCRVRGISNLWAGSRSGRGAHFTRLTLASDAYAGTRTSEWAPSAYLASTPDAGTTWVARTAEFGPGGGVVDLASFAVGWRVLIGALSALSLSAMTEHTITAIDLGISEVQVSPAFVGSAADAIMQLAPYDDADTIETERKRVYWSGGDNKLVSPDGSDPAFIYV